MTFWDEKSIVGLDAVNLSTPAFDTEAYTEVQMELAVYGILGTATTTLSVAIEISNDGKNWIITSTNFAPVNAQIPGPLQSAQITTPLPIGKFMRCSIQLINTPPIPGTMVGATFSIIGVGRN